MRRFAKALRLCDKLDDDAASEDFSASKSALEASCLDYALLSRANENDVLLYIQATSAHRRDRKQNATIDSNAFYPYAASLLQQLERMHSTACKKHPLNFNYFLVIEIPLTRTSSLLLKKLYLNTMAPSSYDPTYKIGTLAACVKSRYSTTTYLVSMAARTIRKEASP